MTGSGHVICYMCLASLMASGNECEISTVMLDKGLYIHYRQACELKLSEYLNLQNAQLNFDF